MIPFLKQVAEHYYNGGGVERCCFIFPNRRSMAFFMKYLSESVKGASSPIIAPQMFTINDFFYAISGKKAIDRVTQLLELYQAYVEVFYAHNQQSGLKPESLDEFIFWGEVILSDFNDVDKYLVDPKQLFANVSDFKQLQDTFSYLTETQRAAIEGFVSHSMRGCRQRMRRMKVWCIELLLRGSRRLLLLMSCLMHLMSMSGLCLSG